jgi:RNA polymerase sigma-70 factor (sigma-E family)
MTVSPDFVQFAESRGEQLRKFAFLLCADPHLAEDLVQTALVRLLPRWERVSSAGSPNAYARTIIVNEHRSLWRRRLRYQRFVQRPDSDSVHDRAFDRVDDADALSRALAQLPAGQRAAAILRFYEDRSERETAEILGCSVGTVKSQTHRALSGLRTALTSEVQEKC